MTERAGPAPVSSWTCFLEVSNLGKPRQTQCLVWLDAEGARHERECPSIEAVVSQSEELRAAGATALGCLVLNNLGTVIDRLSDGELSELALYASKGKS